MREEAAVCVEDQGLIKFSVWVSFAEIYNEQIFDLLEPIPKKKTTRRPVLRLSDDKNGSPYIRGMLVSDQNGILSTLMVYKQWVNEKKTTF